MIFMAFITAYVLAPHLQFHVFSAFVLSAMLSAIYLQQLSHITDDGIEPKAFDVQARGLILQVFACL